MPKTPPALKDAAEVAAPDANEPTPGHDAAVTLAPSPDDPLRITPPGSEPVTEEVRTKPIDSNDEKAKEDAAEAARHEPSDEPDGSPALHPTSEDAADETPRHPRNTPSAPMPAVGVEIVVEALRQTGRPTINRTDFDRDIEATVKPNDEGPGLVLTVEKGVRAHLRADAHNRSVVTNTAQDDAQEKSVQDHLDLIEAEYTKAKEDHAAKLLQDFEMEEVQRAYDSNVANIKGSLTARLDGERRKRVKLPAIQRFRWVIEETDPTAFLAGATIES